VGWPRRFFFLSFFFEVIVVLFSKMGIVARRGLGHTHNGGVLYDLEVVFFFLNLRLIHGGLRTTKYVYSYNRHSDSLRAE
jgi:hypothetical protein